MDNLEYITELDEAAKVLDCQPNEVCSKVKALLSLISGLSTFMSMPSPNIDTIDSEKLNEGNI